MLSSALGRVLVSAAVAAVVLGTVAISMVKPPEETSTTYVTWDGIGPDKWASIWLLRRHIDPSAKIEFSKQGSAAEDAKGIAFDIPGSGYMREGKTTTFEALLASELGQPFRDDPEIQRIAAIINEMEVSRWNIISTSDTGMVEQGFRNLQFRYDRESVPFACYMSFFDSLETMLERSGATTVDVSIKDTGDRVCEVLPETGSMTGEDVRELNVRNVLETIDRGAKIVFVDTREKAEFDEFHIPGAVHMPLREISAEKMYQFKDADLVIPYCVKDFRGYEVARAMSTLGVNNVAILNPYGIRGWRTAGLPVTGSRALSVAEGEAALSACAADPESCL